MARKPWVLDGIARWERQVIIRVSSLTDSQPDITLRLVKMPFLETDATVDDSSILDSLSSLYWGRANGRQDLLALLAHPWLQGGIKDGQRATVELLAIRKHSPEMAAVIDTLPWVQDGIDPNEARAVSTLHEASQGTRHLIPPLAQKPWVRDGLSNVELDAIWALMGIAWNDPQQGESAALSLLEMPFLRKIDQIDVDSLRSLRDLSGSGEDNHLRWVLSHPALSGGITDRQTALVSVLGWVKSGGSESTRRERLDVLLDSAQTTVEERSVVLPRAGHVRVTVVRPPSRAHATITLLEQAMRVQEGFMLEAFPRTFQTLLLADADTLVKGSAQRGTASLDIEDAHDDFSVAGIVAQSCWGRVPSTWIVGGGALMLQMATLYPTELHSLTFDLKCETGVSIAEMERRERNLGTGSRANPTSVYFCLYDLGLAMFLDLYSHLGDQQFRQGFQRLYVKLRDEVHEDLCRGDKLGACYAKAAFVTDADPHSAAIAALIINRRYYGSEHGSH